MILEKDETEYFLYDDSYIGKFTYCDGVYDYTDINGNYIRKDTFGIINQYHL